MWSEKKSINIVVNILLFLMAMNFMHYGQLFLPVICIILFIDNKFKFRVKNIKIFIILCLFAITFCLFSYKLGFYCIMGYCLPMAYYIGSNLKEKNDESIKKIVYLLVFGMASHVVLNFALELSFWGNDLQNLFNKISHYDIWLYLNLPIKYGCTLHIEDFEIVKQARVRTTITSMYFVMLNACVYYLAKYERNKILKSIGLILFGVCFVYSFALGRRTTFVLLIVSILFAIIYDNFVINRNTKLIFVFGIFLLFFVAAFVTIFFTNVFNLKSILSNISIFNRILNKGLNTERISIFINFIKESSYHLWGGQEISEIIGVQAHDLWSDIYDYAGIIPFMFFAIFSFYLCKNVLLFVTKMSKELKIMFIPFFIIATIQLFLEPIITGASLYLICYIIISTVLID